MVEVTVNIPNQQLDYFMEILKNLQFAQVKKVVDKPLTPAQQAVEIELHEALVQAELHRQGKIKLNDARTFLLKLKKEQEQNLQKA
jgi:hypothetical protein